MPPGALSALIRRSGSRRVEASARIPQPAADDAVAVLNKAGYKAFRLEEGLPDWKAMGLPVESN